MAKVVFQYRSKKDKANLEARLLFTHNSERFSFYSKTEIEIKKDFWDELKGFYYKSKKNAKGETVLFHDKDHKKYGKRKVFINTDKINDAAEIDHESDKIKDFVLDNFKKADIALIDSNWFKKTVSDYYNPPKPEQSIPSDLLDYFKYYLETNAVSMQQRINTWRNWLVVKGKLERFLSGKKYEIENVDMKFKNEWQSYFLKEGYAESTIKKDFRYIRQICIKAREEGIKTFPSIDKIDISLTDQSRNLPVIYLSINELRKIKGLKNLPSYLDNVRDWLLISSMTGQRISDFMRFEKSMLQTRSGRIFLDIKQIKTEKDVSIPIMQDVLNILEKREGNFPRPISEQKYNAYVKEVVKRAGIDQLVRGGLKINNRRVIDNYPKWMLISSHSGRRSFASNYYKTLNTVTLKKITGHKRDETFLAYIGEDVDKADKSDHDKMTKAGLSI